MSIPFLSVAGSAIRTVQERLAFLARMDGSAQDDDPRERYVRWNGNEPGVVYLARTWPEGAWKPEPEPNHYTIATVKDGNLVAYEKGGLAETERRNTVAGCSEGKLQLSLAGRVNHLVLDPEGRWVTWQESESRDTWEMGIEATRLNGLSEVPRALDREFPDWNLAS
ncbi:MAG: hypothetical protein AB1758_18540 [Candidatus Eremiobacterota bacterium]